MITLTHLTAIAAKHGLKPPDRMPVPWTGAASRVYPLGEVVVKIPFDRSDAIEAVTIDAAIAPVARNLGVPVPELIAFDDSRDIVPVPFAIFRRVDGAKPLERTGRSGDARATWKEVGRQLARVHAVTDPGTEPIELRTFRQSPEVDPRPWVTELEAAGTLGREDARWLRDVLEEIAPAALAEAPLALCHGDVNAANILVNERTHRFRALIDWAGAGWLDPVWDFAGVSLEVVPWMLAGYRSVAPLPNDATAEARILWCQIQMRLFSARQVSDLDDAKDQLGNLVRRLRQHVRATSPRPFA